MKLVDDLEMLRGTFNSVAHLVIQSSPEVAKAITALNESISTAWALAVSAVNTVGIRADLGQESPTLFDVLVTGDAVRAKLDSRTARELYRKVVRLYHADVADQGSSLAMTMARIARNACDLPVLYGLLTIRTGMSDPQRLQEMISQADGRLGRAQGITRPIVAAYVSGNLQRSAERLHSAIRLAEIRQVRTIHNYIGKL